MLDYRKCGDCGTRFPRGDESCPSCGRFALAAVDLVRGPRLGATVGAPLVAALIALFAPQPWSTALLGASFTPALAALAWLLWRRTRRDSESFRARIEALHAQLDALDRDLDATDRRLDAARQELDAELRVRAQAMLRREVAQDRRLQAAQRRLVLQLERRLEQLELERFRLQLRYFEACRDAQVEDAALVHELDALIRAVPDEHLGDGAWSAVLEDAHLLHRQLARGVSRLRAARRLDPLAFAELAGQAAGAAPEPVEVEGDLDAQLDLHLERIERGFEALEEIAAELVGDPDASGVRLRVDDEVMAQLDEAAELELELEAEGRISGTDHA